MFYERDMKLGEIIKFTGEAIKRNKKLYINMFIMCIAWNVFVNLVSFVLPDMGGFNNLIMIVLFIISFSMLLGFRKVIYGSIYDEDYLENYDRKSVIDFVKGRWLKVLFMSFIVWFGGAIVMGLILSIPMTVIIFNLAVGEFPLGSILWLVFIIIVLYLYTLLFLYYLFELNLNNNIKMAHSEIMSILKIKKMRTFLSALPLTLFTVFIHILWFFGVYGPGYFIGKNIGAFDNTSDLLIVTDNVFINVLTVVGVIILSVITVYVQSLWITKYYNMKNAIVYNLNGGKNIEDDENDSEDNIATVEVSDNKAVENVQVVKEVATEIVENVQVVKQEATEVVENVEAVKEETTEVVEDVQPEKEIKIEDSEVIEKSNEEANKQNSNDESNIVGETSMWGNTSSIEDSVIGKKD